MTDRMVFVTPEQLAAIQRSVENDRVRLNCICDPRIEIVRVDGPQIDLNVGHDDACPAAHVGLRESLVTADGFVTSEVNEN